MRKIKEQIKDLFLESQISEEALNALGTVYHEITEEMIDFSDFVSKEKKIDRNLVFYGAKEEFLQTAQKEQPKITVIIPTYNRSEMLCKCVDSVLMQRYQNIEIIIIDDCSTDNTQSLIENRYKEEARVHYVRNDKNLGPGGNRQKAYNMSSGEYIIFADDDDYYFEPMFFTKAIALFLEFPTLSMVCANSVIHDIVKKTLLFVPVSFCGVMEGKRFFMGFRTKYRKPNSTFPTVYKKSALKKADFANMWMMNDTSIYLRAACVGDVCMMKDWVGVYLVHESNISKSLPHEFILQNLDEKVNIYNIAQNKYGENLDDWLYSQLMDTIKYYLHSERISAKKFISLLGWIYKNGGSIRQRLMKASLFCQFRLDSH